MENMEFKSIESNVDSQEEGIFEGYAAYFNNVDSYDDVILPGAFTGGQNDNISDIKVVFNHDWEDIPVGVLLEILEDINGLKIKAKVIDTSKGKDVKVALKEKAITKMSIGYTVLDYEYKKENGKTIRYIKKIKLYEVSPVLFPANNKADIQNYKKEGGVEVDKQAKQYLSDIMEEYLSDLMDYVRKTEKKQEFKGLETQISLETQMLNAVNEKQELQFGRMEVCAIYANEFVLNNWGYVNPDDDNSWFDKYYRVGYGITNGNVEITGDLIEVVPTRTFVDKKGEGVKVETKKEEQSIGLEEVLKELKNINKK